MTASNSQEAALPQGEGSGEAKPERASTREIVVRAIISLAILGSAAGSAGILYVMFKAERVEKTVSEKPLLVDTATVVSHQSGIDFEVDGEVVPYRNVRVASEVAGRVVQMSPNCRVGRFVGRGELLVQINQRDYELEMDRLRLEWSQAVCNVEELDTDVGNLQLQIEIAKDTLAIRQRELARFDKITDPGAYSEAEVDLAKGALLVAKNSLQTLENQLESARTRRVRLVETVKLVGARMDQAQENLDRTNIYAPISGVVTEHSVERNGFVQKGGPVCTIQDISKLEVRCSLYMKQVDWLWRTDRLASEDLYVESSLKESAAEQPMLASSTSTDPNPLGLLRETIASEAASVIPMSRDPIHQRPELDEDAADDAFVMEEPPANEASLEAFRFNPLQVKVIYDLATRRFCWNGLLRCYDGSSLDKRTRMMPFLVTIDNPLDAELVDPSDGEEKASHIADGKSEPSSDDDAKLSPEATEPATPEEEPEEDHEEASEAASDNAQSTLDTSDDGPKKPSGTIPSLMAGMYVRVRIHAAPDVPLLRLPEEAILPGGEVWMVRDGVLHRTHVRVAQMTKQGAIVYAQADSLVPGDQVVVSPMAAPLEGIKVAAIDDAKTSSGDNPTGDQSADDKPASDKPEIEKPASDDPATGSPEEAEPAAEPTPEPTANPAETEPAP